MSLDSVKAAIINEVEDSANQANDQNKVSLRVEALLSWASGKENDFLVTPEALEQCKLYGLDCRYSYNKLVSDKCQYKVVQNKAADESMLEERLHAFMSMYEGFPTSADDDLDTTPIKAKVLAFKIHSKAFDPLLVHLKETRPAFCRVLQQHPLLTGKSNSAGKRKQVRSKRERKMKDAKEKDKASVQAVAPESLPHHAVSRALIDISNEANPSWEHYRHVLAVIVTKALSDGSMQSILIAVSLLFQVMNMGYKNDSSSSGAGLSKLIPVGDILWSIFEKKTVGIEKSSSVSVPNPFRRCVSPDDKGIDNRKRRAMSDSMSRTGGDLCSVGTSDEILPASGAGIKGTSVSGVSEDSRFLVGVNSDAGSTVGSTVGSVLAEQGTETASIGGGEGLEHLDIICEDANEDELLAQALALSLSGAQNAAIANPVNHQSVSFNLSGRSGISPTLSDSTARDSNKPSSAELVNYEKLVEVYPMSTFGPFCSEDFWSHEIGTEASPIALDPGSAKSRPFERSANDVPIENVIIALVAYVRGGIDAMFNEDSAPFMNADSNPGDGCCRSDLLVGASLELVPLYTMHFSLLENLLDATLLSLVRSTKSAPLDASRPSKLRNNQERIELDIAIRKWNFERYFLTWMANSTLSILKANLHMLVISGTSPSSIGLDHRRSGAFNGPAGALGASAASGGSTGITQPLLVRLLKLVVECIGATNFPNGIAGGRVDLSFDVNSAFPAALLSARGQESGGSSCHSGSWAPCDAEYRHCLAISAVETFCSGYPTFFASDGDRENVFYALMYNSPQAGAIELGCFYFNLPFFTLKRYSHSVMGKALSECLPPFYRAYLFQKLCLYAASTRLGPFFPSDSSSDYGMGKVSEGQSVALDHVSVFDDPVPPNNLADAATFSSEHVRGKFIGFWPSAADPLAGKDLRESPSYREGGTDNSGLLQSLYSCLISRLGQPCLMKECYQRCNVDSRGDVNDFVVGPSSCVFWGELSLLETIQQHYLQQLYNPPSLNHVSDSFVFDQYRCSRNIAVGEDGYSVTQQKNKEWSTVVSSSGFSPNTGVHKWSIRIDRCGKGNVFIGVVAAESTVNNYVGYDRHGWGFIGTPSLWHDRVKVRSNYGVKVVEGSVVHVTLDTDKGTLSYVVSGTEWGIAFANLPKRKLFPAVSLYQLGDTVSVDVPNVSRARSSGKSSAVSVTGKKNIPSCVKGVLKYIFAMFAEVDEVLRFSLRADITSDHRLEALCHPFLVTLFPQLAATFASEHSLPHELGTYITFKMLPQLTLLSKMFAAAHEMSKGHSFYHQGQPVSPNAILSDVCGEWRIDSGASGGLPAQSYRVFLTTAQSVDADRGQDIVKVLSTPVVNFYGVGMNETFSLKVAGTLIGTRIRLMESWVDSDVCHLDARLSLDGSSFLGEFTTANHTGSIKGVRLLKSLSHYKEYSGVNSLLKAALVGVMACGSLSCNLMLGIEPSSESILREHADATVATAHSKLPSAGQPGEAARQRVSEASGSSRRSGDEPHIRITNSAGSYADMVFEDGDEDNFIMDEEENSNEEDEESDGYEEEEKHDNEQVSMMMQAQEVLLADASGPSESEPAADSSSEDMSRRSAWLSSVFLSSGLHLDSALRSMLNDEILYYLSDDKEVDDKPARKKLRLESTDTGDILSVKSKQIQDYWVEKVFSGLLGAPPETSSTFDPESISSPSNSIPLFCQNLIDAKLNATNSSAHEAYLLDQHIIHHTGMAALSRIGGDALQNARRTILSVLIKHCGCSEYCKRIAVAICGGKIMKEERPSVILMQIWTSGQRVIEQAVRKKQQSGVSYGFIGQELCTKSMVLFDIEPQVDSTEISEMLSLCNFDLCNQSLVAEIQKKMSKILHEAVELLLTPIPDLLHIKTSLIKTTLRALTRTAGFKSLALLLNKGEDKHWICNTKVPSISNALLHSSVLEHVILGVHGCPDDNSFKSLLQDLSSQTSATAGSKATSPLQSLPSSAALETTSIKAARVDVGNAERSFGFYGDGLHGCNSAIFQDLRLVVESIYDFVTQFLQRSTWGVDRNGQCTALACWNIHIQPEDHQFLNRCGIFRVLQTVLNDARAASSDVKALNDTGIIFGGLNEEQKMICSKFFVENRNEMTNKLSRLVMLTVHSLASQIAFSKDHPSDSSMVLGRPLQRQPSGPETLSQALFDVLFSELYFGFRQLMTKTSELGSAALSGHNWISLKENQTLFSNLESVSAPKISITTVGSKKRSEFSLQGEEYIYRILLLLFSVSGSVVCRRYLTSPKWITLLLSGIGYGGFGVQRRLMRLLRRLLSMAKLSTLECFVPSLFGSVGADLFESTSAFDDEDSKMLAQDDASSPEGNDDSADLGRMDVAEDSDQSLDLTAACTKKAVRLFLEAVAVTIPSIHDSTSAGEKNSLPDTDESAAEMEIKKRPVVDNLALLHMQGTGNLISAESIYLLRVLMNSPFWQTAIFDLLSDPFDEWERIQSEGNRTVEDVKLLKRIASAIAVLGGFPERVREGGLVALKPMSLLTGNGMESIALRLASISHSCGLVVEKNKTNNVDVILIERADKRATRGMPTSLLSKKDDNVNQGFFFSGATPIKTVRVNYTDIAAICEFEPNTGSLTSRTLHSLMSFLRFKCLPAILLKLDQGQNTKEIKSADSVSINAIYDTALDTYVTVTAFRAMSKCSENESNVDTILHKSPDLFLDLLSLSLIESLSGGLVVLEKIEERWCSLWDALLSRHFKEVIPSSGVDTCSKESDQPEKPPSPKLFRPPDDSISTDNDPPGATLGLSSGASLLSALRFGQPPGAPDAPERVDSALAGLFGLARVRASPPPQAFGAHSFTVSESAKRAMIEMGLPPEWCDVALRRSRNNVEVAINLCFEHGEDMNRLVEEDLALQQRQQQQQQQQAPSIRGGAGVGGMRIPPSRPGGYAPSLSRRAFGDSSAGDGQERGIDPDAARHMASLGFPISWCTRALQASGNNLDAALEWILHHANELLVENPSAVESLRALGGLSGIGDRDRPSRRYRRENRDNDAVGTLNDSDLLYSTFAEFDGGDLGLTRRGGSEAPVADKIVDDADSESSIIGECPLTVISGRGVVADDYTCSAPTDGSFPSIGCRGYGVASGKWYFEVRILTSSCIQIGWVDTSYQGGAESGQGVGDDLHSWCFDGWRVMLWHEESAEWGARWAPGNIVGCAVDMDERRMIFTLNGEGESVGMGTAFEGFESNYGLYPACSISHGQQIRFNFGARGFKYGPPAGFRPFSDRIIEVNQARAALKALNSAKNVNVLSNLEGSVYCEDSIEEQLGESECTWQKRYFPGDDQQGSSLGGSRSIQFPEPSFSKQIPTSLTQISEQFISLSNDLSILYARLSVFNILQSCCKGKSFLEFVKLLASSFLKDRGYSGLEAVLKLIRLSSVTSNRTKMYLQTVALMKSSASTPYHLGSIFCIGGLPMVDALSESLSLMLDASRQLETNVFVDTILKQIQIELVRSTQRDQSTNWKAAVGLVPNIMKTGQLSDAICSTVPSLNLGVALTVILLRQLVKDFLSLCKDSAFTDTRPMSPGMSKIVNSVSLLSQHWCVGLQSPNILVKLCCIRMLNCIFQEFFVTSSQCSSHNQISFMLQLCDLVPINRLEQLALNRIGFERGASPICSEFLQTLLEFIHTVHNIRSQLVSLNAELTGHVAETSSVHSKVTMNSSIEVDDRAHEFNWDAIHGTLLSDDGWDIWTGVVRHLPTSEWTRYLNAASVELGNNSSRDKQKQSPELLVGCKVARKKKIAPVTPSASDAAATGTPESIGSPSAGDLSSSGGIANTLRSYRQRIANLERRQSSDPSGGSASPGEARPGSSGGSWPRREGFLSASGSEPDSSPSALKSILIKETDWEIGTVEALVHYPVEGSLPGSGRVIRWHASPKVTNGLSGDPVSGALVDPGPSSEPSPQAAKGDEDAGILETVSWGHNGVYDVIHVALNRDGTISQQFPTPKTNLSRAIGNGFCSDLTFGIVLRLRKAQTLTSDKEEGISERMDGVMEWPDFNSSVYVTVTKWEDGAWSITEEKLLYGPSHALWSVRFGHSHWRAGTTYDLCVSKHAIDYSDKYSREIRGQFSIPIFMASSTSRPSFSVVGDISLQQSRLFLFDDKLHSAAINLSHDKVSAFSDGKESRSTVFGNIGFTHGVHYWEFKIEQGDIGSIFIGVADKTWSPGSSGSQPGGQRLSRWMGSGFVNIRTSFRHNPTGIVDRVYGDHFHTGDTVGVLLDMNRGRLSFFLDGLKYGEHSITDLGEAFDGLVSSTSRRKALFPIVGMRKNLDRVTITPRWVSNYGPDSRGISDIVGRACSLLSSWNIERPAIKPLARDMWIYREAWRDYLRWINRSIDRVRTRCRAPLLYVGVDASPVACTEASIRLGLATTLYRGDRFSFTRSGGRLLETAEEAVILGAYRGLLWYRPDTQNGAGSGSVQQISGNRLEGHEFMPPLLEGSALAWQLCPQDVEGLKLIRRSGIVDPKICDLKLPRIPMYRGGRFQVQFNNGAVMRDGTEIDTSEVVSNVDLGAVVTAFEKRVNSSNITRYRVAYKDKVGWISERIRGGSEELMVSEVRGEDPNVVNRCFAEAMSVLKACRIAAGGPDDPCETPWVDVSTLEEALALWEESVQNAVGIEAGLTFLRRSGSSGQYDCSFDHYIEMTATMDGEKQWSVEADMQLAELISRTSSRDGVSPLNVTAQRLQSVVRSLDPANPSTSLLSGVDLDRLTARAAILRVANIIFAYSLPYLSLDCPEEKLKVDLIGRKEDFEIVGSPLKPQGASVCGESSQMSLDDAFITKQADDGENSQSLTSWRPPSNSRKLRSLRRLLFSQTKSTFFDNVLEATTTPTPLPQDEYEEPREIKTIKVNRVMATLPKLSTVKNNTERLRLSVFGQLYKELRGWPISFFRRSYIGKGHGGQKRAFKVKFTGEGVNDYGGPYRAVFEQIVDEVQCDAFQVAGQKPWEKTLLTLLVPCPNRASGSGINQDKFMFVPSTASPSQQELVQFLGRLTGLAVRHNLNLGLDFSSLVWRPLVRLPLARGHLMTVDTLFVNRLSRMERLGLFLEKRMRSSAEQCVEEGGSQAMSISASVVKSTEEEEFELNLPESFDISYRPSEWTDVSFSTYLSDGYTRVPLVPGGENVPVTLGNWREYIRLAELVRLQEGSVMYRAFKDGLSTVLPVPLLPLFTAPELELMISGSRKVDLELLKKCTEYDNIDPDSDLVANFWSVLEGMDDEERTLFLRFVWARSRMPSTAQDFPMNFKLQAASSGPEFLPHAQTCFFSLALPPYPTKEALREKLLYAINNSPNMDADVRLHNAEGWADS